MFVLNRDRSKHCFLLFLMSNAWSLNLINFSVPAVANYTSPNTTWLKEEYKSNITDTNGTKANSPPSTVWTSLTEYCDKFNITMQQCKCQACYNQSENTFIEYLPNQICLMFNKTMKDCSSLKPTPKMTTGKSVDITTLSLEELCQMFSIKTEDCVCPSTKIFQICSIVKTCLLYTSPSPRDS